MARRREKIIRVHVTSYGKLRNGKSRNLCMRYRDPKTGRSVVRSAGTTSRKEALKEAGIWEDELRNGKYKPASKITWEEFRAQYEAEHVDVEMKDNTARGVAGVLNAVERILAPELLSDLTRERIKEFKFELREERVTQEVEGKTVEKIERRGTETVAFHLRVVTAALNWAHDNELLQVVPKIEMPKSNGSKMKGRPITLEEFERILSKLRGDDIEDEADRLRPKNEIAVWERFLWGLWWSGLRLEEALRLTWDDHHAPHVELDGESSTITIPGDCQKNGKNTVGPIVPEFFEFLSETPSIDRTGYVFEPPFRRKDSVSKIISILGKAAGVRVGPKKFASAHDFRRSFGFRWAMRVMPALLQRLMRHASITTTLTYYVGCEAKEMGKATWQAFRAATAGTQRPAANGKADKTEECKEATL